MDRAHRNITTRRPHERCREKRMRFRVNEESNAMEWILFMASDVGTIRFWSIRES